MRCVPRKARAHRYIGEVAAPDQPEMVSMSPTVYLLMFGLPVVAIVVIIGLAIYQASPVENDEREPGPQQDQSEE